MYQLNYILIIIIIILLCSPNKKEGYINNNHPTDKPDNKQFYACHDYTQKDNLGNNNYKVIHHGVGEPLTGAYSSFLDIYRIRKYPELFHSPICEKKYSFQNITSVSPPTNIIDHSDILNQSELLTIEEEYDKNAIKDPYYSYSNPRHIGNKITYSDEANKLFIREHKSHDAENLSHRLDNNVTR